MKSQQPTKKAFVFLPFLSALLMAVPFFLPSLGEFIAPVGFVPLLVFLAQRQFSFKKIWVLSFFSGFVFFGLTLYWLFETLPLDWAGINNALLGFSIFFVVWLVIMAGFSVWWGFFGLGSAVLMRTLPSFLFFAVGIPSLWVASEYLRSFVFGILWFSPGQSPIGPDWTFSNIAYTVSDGSLAFFSRLGGMYLVNFIIMASNGAIAFMLVDTQRASPRFTKKVILQVIGIFVGTLFFAYGLSVIDRNVIFPKDQVERAEEISVAAVRIDFPKRFYFRPFEYEMKKERITNILKTVKNPVDVIVLPEISAFVNAKMYEDESLKEFFQLVNPLVVDHDYVLQDDRLIAQTFYWRFATGTFAKQGKELLMAGGEYLPWILRKGILLFNQDIVIAYTEARSIYQSEKSPVVKDTLGHFSSLLCSEVMSPRIARKSAQSEVDVIFLQTSDAIFQGNRNYLIQMMAMAKMRAIENGKFIVRSSNAGESAIIDPFGKVLASFPQGEGVLFGHVRLLKRKTPYGMAGDAPLLVITFLITGMSFLAFQKCSKKS